MTASSSLPLARFTVLDLTRVRAGPTAARQLADWGANVIKIEAPASIDTGKGLGGARHGPDFQNIHRNKRGITLNLKEPDGKALFERMVRQADVVVENYRPDVKYRLGVDYDTLSAINPRIVLASIAGFGQDGPYVKRPGFDQIAQGMGGLMSITGLPGQGPVRVGVPIADLAAGLYAAIGILVALLQREETGRGQWVHTSLLEAQIAMLDFQAARWTIGGEVPPQAGNNHPTSIPTGVFRTADGYINIAASGDTMWQRLCDALGADDMKADDDFATDTARQKNRDALNERIEAYTVARKSSEWVETLNEAGVPCGPIYKIDEMFEDPQVRHLRMLRTVNPSKREPCDVIRNAVNLSAAPDVPYRATPERGEHTDEVLAEFGLGEQEIALLRKRGIV
ncbi:MAG: CaiB/BaiF CoA-transferase family protein [Gammaproteobacteria bacterium]|nr:CaiB/BaiF CoA-transferase family protein [Gammaproteobacteria bacterium]